MIDYHNTDADRALTIAMNEIDRVIRALLPIDGFDGELTPEEAATNECHNAADAVISAQKALGIFEPHNS